MYELPFVLACASAIVMLLLPAAWHVRSGNSGTLLYIGWSLTGNVIYFVNSIVWSGNVGNPAPIWCDISSKLIVGLTVGLPCASLCIQRRLYLLSRIRTASSGSEERVRALVVDLLIGLGIPVVVMTLHYVVQGHRFNIIEDVGCWPATYITALTIPLLFMWPIIINVVSIPYCVLSYLSFMRRRAEFQQYLATNEPGLNVDRYLRLMALASMEIVLVLPLNLLSIIANVTNSPLQPWVSWAYVHYDFSRVAYIYRFIMESEHKFWIEFVVSRWAIPLSGLLFFIFFGLSIEARKDYSKVFHWILRCLHIKLPSKRPTSQDSKTLIGRILNRGSTTSSKDPFANDNTLTVLPSYTRSRRRPESLASSLEESDDAASDHTVLARSPPVVTPLRIPDASYYPGSQLRSSLSPLSASEEDAFCHTGTSSTAFLLQESPTSATSSGSWNKPLPPIPASRPTSQITVTPRVDDVLGELRPVVTAASVLNSRSVDEGLDGGESIYYTPAAHRLSLMSTDYQPSIPDVPGSWQTFDSRRRPRPQYPF